MGHQVGEDSLLDEVLRDISISVGGLDDSFVSEDSLGSDIGRLLGVVDDLLESLDDVLDSQESEGGDEGSSLILGSVLNIVGPQSLDKGKDAPLDVGWAAVVLGPEVVGSFGFDGVLGPCDSSVDAGLVGEGCEGENGDVLGLLGVFAAGEGLLNDRLEHLDDGDGWSSRIR